MTLTDEEKIIPAFTYEHIMIDDIDGTIFKPIIKYGLLMYDFDWYKDNSHYSDNEIDVREYRGSIYD